MKKFYITGNLLAEDINDALAFLVQVLQKPAGETSDEEAARQVDISVYTTEEEEEDTSTGS